MPDRQPDSPHTHTPETRSFCAQQPTVRKRITFPDQRTLLPAFTGLLVGVMSAILSPPRARRSAPRATSGKSSPFSQHRSETVCLQRSGSSCRRSRTHRHSRLHTRHSRTNMPMHLDGHHMLQFVSASARVFTQAKLMEGVYLIFIWFVLTLSPAPRRRVPGHRQPSRFASGSARRRTPLEDKLSEARQLTKFNTSAGRGTEREPQA